MLDRLVRVGTLVVACLSVTVFFGELFDVALLTGPVAGLAAMKVNTACGLLAAAIALWFVHTCAPGSPWIRVARVFAMIAVAIGGLTLLEDLFGIELGIDQLILRETAPADIRRAMSA
jgi:hypothetical protein